MILECVNKNNQNIQNQQQQQPTHIIELEKQLENLIGVEIAKLREVITSYAIDFYKTYRQTEFKKYQSAPLVLSILTDEIQRFTNRVVVLEDIIWKEVFQIVLKAYYPTLDAVWCFNCMFCLMYSILVDDSEKFMFLNETPIHFASLRNAIRFDEIKKILEKVLFDSPGEYFPETVNTMFLDSLHFYIWHVMLGKSMLDNTKITREMELSKLIEMQNKLLEQEEISQKTLMEFVEKKINEVNNQNVQNWANLSIALLNAKEKSMNECLMGLVDSKINEVVSQQKEIQESLQNSLQTFDKKVDYLIQISNRSLEKSINEPLKETGSNNQLAVKRVDSTNYTTSQHTGISTHSKPSLPTVEWVVPKECVKQFTESLKKYKSTLYIHTVVSYENGKNINSKNKIVYIYKTASRVDERNFNDQIQQIIGCKPTVVVTLHMKNIIEVPFPNVYTQPFKLVIENGSAIVELIQFKPENVEKLLK